MKLLYENLSRQSSRAACHAQILGRPVSDPSVLRYMNAGSLDERGPAHVPEVVWSDDSTSTRAEDVSDVFTEHFARLLPAYCASPDAGPFEECL